MRTVNMVFPWQKILVFCLILCAAVLYSNASIEPANLLTAKITTKPNCSRKCGDLTVPYPFGIGPQCSLDSWFSIICNTSYNPPRAFSMIGLGYSENPDILQITETQLLIRNSQIASRCYGPQGNMISSTQASFDIYASAFTYSRSANKLTVVGCDDYALIYESAGTLSHGSSAQYNYRAGCLTLCSNPNEVIKGSCSGLGCCQTSIPLGLQSFTFNLSSLQNRTIGGISAVQPCGYAFLAGNDSFAFNGALDLSIGEITKRVTEQIPLVLDWAVGRLGNETILSCNSTNTNTTYFCQSNTQCIDSDAGGYNCNCLPGYEGNPYLQPGCTDVDECAAGKNSPCAKVCVNTPGSYNCLCPSGYSGDGLKLGMGCIKTVGTSLTRFTLGLHVTSGTILLLLTGWWLYSIIKRRKIIRQKAKNFERNGGLLLQQQMSSDESVVERMKIFTVEELERATDDFHENRVLGQGGQGTVYKGMLSEGKIVAVKKSKLVDDGGLEGFINEVFILSQINHRNIVKLLGCCLETEVPLLVYEFIPNGNLYDHIHHPSEDFTITWKMRLQIACDSAGALAYLHSSSSIPILHRDIKSSNILLDEKYRAKLSDFGTSRSVQLDQTHVTTRVMGTFGYLDPEYFQTSQFSEKSDVYSFGVVLVELLTGQKAIRSALQEDRSLTSWFLRHMENSSLLHIIDSQSLHDGHKDEFFAVANVAHNCLNLDGKKRPTMKAVLMELEAIQSRHLPQTDEQGKGWQESKQKLSSEINTKYNRDISSSRSAFYLENSSLSSAEMSLLFNPR